MHITGYVFIVGGGIGIGRASARALAKDGAAGLMIADIDTIAAQETAAQCHEVATNQHFRVETTYVGITDDMSMLTATSMTIRLLGQIDYCVNCAGIGFNSNAEIADSDLFAYERMLDVNITGNFLVIGHISDFMRGQGLAAPYTAAKHAVVGMVKIAAIDNIPHGIRVNAVCPSVQAAFEDDPELEEVITKMHPIGRIANAEEVADEVADAVSFLCSDRSSYMTGCALLIDGGSTLTCHV
ncbi:SDR family NAD(P)-dependent oxidoreductase [Aspergillus foveolatus]|uniref:SDR family NAD(P)-dependent oxidoreductase n=1 Tax=Aspergillus foveolatus TaxID=210207 RepID=UPI003CCDD83A